VTHAASAHKVLQTFVRNELKPSVQTTSSPTPKSNTSLSISLVRTASIIGLVCLSVKQARFVNLPSLAYGRARSNAMGSLKRVRGMTKSL